ncbi:NAD(P)H-dependent oxidoreductase subunit E [Roseivivax sediminis]|uniref:NAD(P)-dependent nickel-iron dehydrogenase flavin-containing subunit n=1 Tax=Roseivivax sediminis TaxID=936889 RepID=A0A1I1XWU1_9RHOB|nr:NAD(P)H-dependent oxidoreductase subunit E [Roseivivax sediminis]SFE11836.1 NAD(P)-dependent nickel-iron dehydrogenase flavin-containing subunit [Roseivivax sediminis]
MNIESNKAAFSKEPREENLVTMLWDIQRRNGWISKADVRSLAAILNVSPLDIDETLSFYHFFRSKPSGRHQIYLCDSVIARMNGYDQVRAALERETNCCFGGLSADGLFGLEDTPCIGLSDQEPAMMIGDVVFTGLTPEAVSNIVAQLRAGKLPADIANPNGYDSGTLDYVDAMVVSRIRNQGPVFFKPMRDHHAVLQGVLARHPIEIIDEIAASKLRGRGGAGFPTGLKWRLAHEAEGGQKFIICNADEGEPGTFKDRCLLTRSPRDVLIGMVVAGFAVGARSGILYLRAEYWYLKDYLERHIGECREAGLLGDDILGSGFAFDIRIQMGAGAYICGDETALIESCEGKRGTPRVKPPYPIQSGYLGMPTVVNNVETFAIVSRIVEEGGRWYASMGTEKSSGTRLLSVSGDCARPGIYEIEWGMRLDEVLGMVGASRPMAVQVSGPSGECVSAAKDGGRVFCYSDLSCNGSLMIFDESRDLLGIIRHFMSFFVQESCGICTPCRSGCVDMLTKVDRVIGGKATKQDLEDCNAWGHLMRSTSRCGLGTTAAKPILTTMKSFPELYRDRLAVVDGPILASFDLEKALKGHEDAFRNLVKDNY